MVKKGGISMARQSLVQRISDPTDRWSERLIIVRQSKKKLNEFLVTFLDQMKYTVRDVINAD